MKRKGGGDAGLSRGTWMSSAAHVFKCHEIEKGAHFYLFGKGALMDIQFPIRLLEWLWRTQSAQLGNVLART